MSEQPLSIVEDTEPASIQSLIDKIRVPNLAEDIADEEDGESVLNKIADQVIKDFTTDDASMDDWKEFIDKGKILAKQETTGKSDPWENSANFKSPVLLNASIKFGDRASTTLLRQRDLIKMDVTGKDEDNTKKDRAERISTHMNYQLNYDMIDWREDQDQLFYWLGDDGCVFKQTFFDAAKGRNVSEIIRYPNFAVNENTEHIDEAQSFTIIREFNQNKVIEKQREGIWLDVDINIERERPEGQNPEDSDDRFYEQQMFYDLDKDGYAEPYIATVHVASNQVVRLIARFEEDNIFVKVPSGAVVTLDRVLNPIEGDDFEFETDEVLNELELIRIEPITTLTKYGFIPSIEGTFLNIGYFHLLASITQMINSSANDLINAGTLQTQKTGFLAKGFRKKMGDLKIKMGQLLGTDIPAADLQNGINLLDFGEPSQTLLVLNQNMKAEAQEISASADLTQAIGANAPATTMLGLIQEQMMPVSALIQRIYRAEKQEFKKLFLLNAKFTDPSEYQNILDEEADFRADYAPKGLDIWPAANPEMTSKIQRLIQAEILLEQSDRILQQGGNPIPIMKEFIDIVGFNKIDEVFPPQNPEAEKQQLEEMKQDKALQAGVLQAQVDFFKGQVENGRLRADNERQKIDDAALKMVEDIRKIRSEVVLNLEKAETEDAKNQLDSYTKDLDNLLRIVQTIEAQNANRQAVVGPTGPAQ